MMRKVLCCVAGLSLLTAGSAFATGYQIPVQSYDSVAKAGANIASASDADAAYFNPAGAAWVKDGWVMQIDATYLHLTKVEYHDNRTNNNPYGINFDSTSLAENFFIPTFFLLSPTWKDFRFGFSITAPNGLAKRWEDGYASVYSHKFSLQVYEFNPTLTYAFNDKFSIAGGARMLYTSATVVNQAGAPYPSLGGAPAGTTLNRDMNGSSIDWGYNLAADFRPTKELNLAVTFRSKVDLTITGNGTMQTNYGGPFLSPSGYFMAPKKVSSRGSITIPSPAVLSFSGSYNFGRTTAELTINRTYWSKLKGLDFNYDTNVASPAAGGNPLFASFTAPEPRDWHDTTAVRLGFEYEATKKLTMMAGICYSESPAPDHTLSFELPDADTWAVSIGGRYAFTDNLDIGLGVLYDTAATRWVGGGAKGPANESGMNGEITSEAALLVTLGLQYRF